MKKLLLLAALAPLLAFSRDTNRYDSVRKTVDGVTLTQRGGMGPSNEVVTAISFGDLFTDLKTNNTSTAATVFRELVAESQTEIAQDFKATSLTHVGEFFENIRTNKVPYASQRFEAAVKKYSPPPGDYENVSNKAVNALQPVTGVSAANDGDIVYVKVSDGPVENSVRIEDGEPFLYMTDGSTKDFFMYMDRIENGNVLNFPSWSGSSERTFATTYDLNSYALKSSVPNLNTDAVKYGTNLVTGATPYIAIGTSGTTASSQYATAVGHGAVVDAVYGTSIGCSDVHGQYGLGIGVNALVFQPAQAGVAIGYGVVSSNTQALAIGGTTIANLTGIGNVEWPTTAAGVQSVALGVGAHAMGDASVSVGQLATATNVYTTAVGPAAVVYGKNAAAVGFGCSAIDDQTFAAGFMSVAGDLNGWGDHATAIGYNAIAKGYCDTAIGHNAAASNNYNLAVGYDAVACNPNSGGNGFAVALGQHNLAKGKDTVAIGTYSIATNNQSVVIGATHERQTYNSSHGTGTITLGVEGTAAQVKNKIYIGNHRLGDLMPTVDTSTLVPNTREVNGKALSSDVSLEVADIRGGTYVSNKVETTSQSVATWASYWDGDDVRVTITNYNSATRFPELYLEQKVTDTEATPPTNYFKTVWKEMTWLNWLKDEWIPTNFYTKAQMDSELDQKADRAWGFYDSHSGELSPEGYTQISSSNIMIAANMSYQKTVTTDGAIWVLTSTGVGTQMAPTTNGFFRISDDKQNSLFEIRIGDKHEVGADSSGLTTTTVSGKTHLHITYSVVSDAHPKIYVAQNLATPTWYEEGTDGFPCTVSWTGTSGNWQCELYYTGSDMGQLFVKAGYMVGGDTMICNVAPVEMQYLYLNGHKYSLGTAVISGNTVLTLTLAD